MEHQDTTPMSKTSSERCDDTLSSSTPIVAPRVNVISLITPRYQKKQRVQRRIEVTDSSGDRLSAAEALQKHTKEILTVHNGPLSYEQEMYFHPHELYKHGKHRIYTSSVGYGSDGDLVIRRESVSEPSDVDLGFIRRRSEIDKAICLDPRAHRPLKEEELGKKLSLNAPKDRKYPGIRAPKNRKVRNRLLNDYFASEYAQRIIEKYRERQAKGEGESDTTPLTRPVFGNLPSVFYDMLELDEDAQTRHLEECGVKLRPSVNFVPKDPNSGEARFQAMNSRLRSELVHAMNSVFLTRQIDDLERSFANFVAEGNVNKPMIYNFRDGYGRLVCHGVAAYYQLVSESRYQQDGTKITVVSWPKKKRKKGSVPLVLPHVPLMQLLRRNCSDTQIYSPMSTPQNTPHTKAEKSDVHPPSFNLDGTPKKDNATDGEAPQRIAVYEPRCVIVPEGETMTATQQKKMRRAMRLSQRGVGNMNKEVECATLVGCA